MTFSVSILFRILAHVQKSPRRALSGFLLIGLLSGGALESQAYAVCTPLLNDNVRCCASTPPQCSNAGSTPSTTSTVCPAGEVEYICMGSTAPGATGGGSLGGGTGGTGTLPPPPAALGGAAPVAGGTGTLPPPPAALGGAPVAGGTGILPPPPPGGLDKGGLGDGRPLIPNPPPGGSPAPGGGAGGFTPTAGIQRDGSYNFRRYGNSDPCAISSQIDGKFSCASTYGTVEMARMGNIMTQTMGATATQAMGAQGQAAAYSGGSQSAAMKAAASTQDNTGSMQLTIGAGNVALGAIQLMQATKHSSHGKNIESSLNSAALTTKGVEAGGTNAESDKAHNSSQAGWVSSSNQLADKALTRFKVNEHSEISMTANPNLVSGPQFEAWKAQRERQGKAHQSEAEGALRDIAGDASSEQKRVQATAMMGGMMSMVVGGTQVANGAASKAAAAKLRAAADALGDCLRGAGGRHRRELLARAGAASHGARDP